MGLPGMTTPRWSMTYPEVSARRAVPTPAGSTRGLWWTVGLLVLRHQRLALGVSGALVSGCIALAPHLMSVTGDALPSLSPPGKVPVSSLERFLFGILITAGICISWPTSRRITLVRMMAAVAVAGVVLAAIHRRRDLEERHRFHEDKAANATLAALNRVSELNGFQKTVGCILLVDPKVESDPSVQRWFRLRDYHEALARKYEFAASHCWLPISSDPPLPGP